MEVKEDESTVKSLLIAMMSPDQIKSTLPRSGSAFVNGGKFKTR
jgi:hypothetical protein